MKTIITTLPIYDKIAKQCFQRAASVRQSTDKPFSIVCPRHRLPSWQYNTEAVAVGAVIQIDLINEAGSATDITTYFPTLSDSHVVGTDTYYKYDGDTLNYLLAVGIYYLKITHANEYIYYSEWFQVNCVFENLITAWTNDTYETFTSTGAKITNAQETGADGVANSGLFSLSPGETISYSFYLHRVSGAATEPAFVFAGSGGDIDSHATVVGLNTGTFTATIGDSYHLYFRSIGAAQFHTEDDVYAIREYSTKYLTLNFHNDCDLYNILYHTGWNQSMWFESEPMEMLFPQEEEGVKNGDGRFIRSFARQDKKYIARTKAMPDYMVDVFNRMKLHETVELIDLVGDTHDVYNLEVEHEWLDTDKYYARISLTFDYDEAFVVAGCCNNI